MTMCSILFYFLLVSILIVTALQRNLQISFCFVGLIKNARLHVHSFNFFFLDFISWLIDHGGAFLLVSSWGKGMGQTATFL